MIANKCLTQGDCVRACITSLLGLNPLMAPDFFEDDRHAIEAWNMVGAFLKPHKLAIAHFGIPAFDMTFADVVEALGISNPGINIMLTGLGAGGRNHMVIVRDGSMVHDPSWSNTGLVGPIPTEPPMWRMSVLTPLLG